jgi:hypothetical protein
MGARRLAVSEADDGDAWAVRWAETIGESEPVFLLSGPWGYGGVCVGVADTVGMPDGVTGRASWSGNGLVTGNAEVGGIAVSIDLVLFLKTH